MINIINCEELKSLMDSQEDFVLIDCREEDERVTGHLPNDVFVPLSMFNKVTEVVEDRNKKVVLYCVSGNRSARAAAMMMHEGYENLHNLIGGINGWRSNNLEIVVPE